MLLMTKLDVPLLPIVTTVAGLVVLVCALRELRFASATAPGLQATAAGWELTDRDRPDPTGTVAMIVLVPVSNTDTELLPLLATYVRACRAAAMPQAWCLRRGW